MYNPVEIYEFKSNYFSRLHLFRPGKNLLLMQARNFILIKKHFIEELIIPLLSEQVLKVIS